MNFKVRKNNNIFVSVCVNIARYFFFKNTHIIFAEPNYILTTYFSLKWPAFRQISLLRGLKAPEGIKPLACCSWFSRVYPVKKKLDFYLLPKIFREIIFTKNFVKLISRKKWEGDTTLKFLWPNLREVDLFFYFYYFQLS